MPNLGLVELKTLRKISILLITLIITSSSFGQAWYNQLKSEHKRSRFGMGIVASDPLGLGFEIFKGEFCSNGNGYKTGSIWMLNLGVENVITMPTLSDEVNYEKTGTLELGGLRGEFGYLFKIFSIAPKAFTLQFHFGPAVEGGTRKYIATSTIGNGPESISTFDYAANGHARLTVTTSGVEMGHGIVFISFHAGLKYHYVINADYSYLKPTFGIIFRKVR